MRNEDQSLIFEITKEGRIGYSLPELDVPELDLADLLPAGYHREEAAELPEVSELDIMRHYTALSKRNHGIDSGFYPLGSCTMKYNPKINESVARY
ncbi:aminomethyl-transferring glycine dehydrogenase subunit GcvPB, partial [Microvirga sp. 3-52]|nr:aminomethyl-transferring glycine dehydrogenase subunit GcvPB [Microvirga sp. 3-52]